MNKLKETSNGSSDIRKQQHSCTYHKQPKGSEFRIMQAVLVSLMSYRICINSLEVPVTHTFAKGDRCSTQRVSEHTLKRLLRSMTQSSVTSYTEANSPASQMANHLVASGQNVDSTQSFEALMCNANLKLLVFNEAILITVSHPALCAQKWLTLSISLS